MVRAGFAAVCVCLVGCGRGNFQLLDASPPADSADAPPIDPDAPPVPGVICSVDRIPLSSLPAAADLAITGTAEGYAAVWVDAAGALPAQGLLLEPNRRLRAQVALPEIHDTRIGGLTDVGQQIVLSTGNAASQTTWLLGRDLAAAAPQTTLTGAIMAHGPFPSETSQLQRVFVSGTDKQVNAAFMASDGTINAGSRVSFTTQGNVTDVACADGPDHSHCTFVEALTTVNGASQCTATDVRLTPVLSIPGGPVLSPDCYDVRVSSGPDVADSVITVWATMDHRIESSYVGGGGLDMPRTIAPAGSAPKVQFDGTRFWIAFLDGEGALQLSSFDLAGRVVANSLAGWVPIGPEAFELVRRGTQAAVALLSPAGLEFLTICP